MTYYSQYQSFVKVKDQFFLTTSPPKFNNVEIPNFKFLSSHLYLIHAELANLKVLLADDEALGEKAWLYYYFCARMLETYYAGYGKKDKEEEYKKLSREIKQYINHEACFVPAYYNSFFVYVKDKIIAGAQEMLSTPLHLSKVRNWVAFINITRLQFTFSRLATDRMFRFATNQQWVAQLENLMQTPIDMDGTLKQLNSANGIFNILSVGLFTARIMINAGMLLKHMVAPSKKEEELTTWERVKFEVYKRHCDFANDIVWALVNLITNFNWVAAPLASPLISVFLTFDICLLIYRKNLAANEYKLKKAQFIFERDTALHEFPFERDEVLHQRNCERLRLINAQIDQLEVNWLTTSANFNFNIGAATLLMSGFTASLLFTASVAAPLSFLVCTLGAAMYLSADLYSNYELKKILLHGMEEKLAQKEARESFPKESSEQKEISAGKRALYPYLEEVAQAKRDLITGMVKNGCLPILFLGTISVSVPAALIFVGLFIAYETIQGYCVQKIVDDPEVFEAATGSFC
jgi:hypothetical protein